MLFQTFIIDIFRNTTSVLPDQIKANLSVSPLIDRKHGQVNNIIRNVHPQVKISKRNPGIMSLPYDRFWELQNDKMPVGKQIIIDLFG